MKETVWIFNHYATNQYLEKNGRHYNLGVNLARKNHEIVIFCANTVHNSNEIIPIPQGDYTEKTENGIKFVFLKTCNYHGNGINRVKNMCMYYKQLFKVVSNFPSPDIIIGSSMHILACEAALRIKKRYPGCKAIVEMRDLWTESLVGYENMSKMNPIIAGSYCFEKHLYKRADAVIFTMPGGKEYIKDQGWSKQIDEKKIHYINNGINLDVFEKNKKEFQINDEDLDNKDIFKIIYAGSIRKANCIDHLIMAMEEMNSKLNRKFVFLIYGDGDEKEALQKYCQEHNLINIKFKGKVEKKFIPYILSRADLNILNVDSSGLWKYGSSQNKLFDYLAAAKPIFCNAEIGYSLLTEYHCGIHASDDNVTSALEAFEQFFKFSDEQRAQMGTNAYIAAEQFDYSKLSQKLEAVFRFTKK